MLGLLKYRRQVNRKTLESSPNPDRDAQSEHINAAVIATQAAGQPAISVDTKKKELAGSYKSGGSDYRPQGYPDKVNVHDFVDKELGKAIPYGVYDLAGDEGSPHLGPSARRNAFVCPTTQDNPSGETRAGGSTLGRGLFGPRSVPVPCFATLAIEPSCCSANLPSSKMHPRSFGCYQGSSAPV